MKREGRSKNAERACPVPKWVKFYILSILILLRKRDKKKKKEKKEKKRKKTGVTKNVIFSSGLDRSTDTTHDY